MLLNLRGAACVAVGLLSACGASTARAQSTDPGRRTDETIGLARDPARRRMGRRSRPTGKSATAALWSVIVLCNAGG